MSMKVYSRTLSADEVVDRINGIFDINVDKAEFHSCRPELIQKIYSMFVVDFGTNLEKLNQVSFNTPMFIQQNPDMFKHFLFPAQLARSVSHYLRRLYDEENFAVSDIVSPKLNRTVKYLTQLISFYEFVYENNYRVIEKVNEAEAKQEEVERLKNEIESLKKEYQRKMMTREEEKIGLEKAQQDLTHQMQEMNELQEISKRLKGRKDGINSEIEFLSSNIKEKELNLLEIRDKIKSLKNQIVLDEDLHGFEECSGILERAKKENLELIENCKEFQKSAEDIDEECKLLEKSLKALDEFDEEFQKSRKIENDRTKGHQHLEEAKNEIETLNHTLVSKKQFVSDLDGEKHEMNRKVRIKKAELEARLEDLNIALETQAISDRKNTEGINERENRIKDIDIEIAKVEEQRQYYLNTVNEALQMIYKKYEVACRHIDAQLESIKREE